VGVTGTGESAEGPDNCEGLVFQESGRGKRARTSDTCSDNPDKLRFVSAYLDVGGDQYV
jgi:hypothetical protein